MKNKCFSCKYEPEWDSEFWDIDPNLKCRFGICFKRPSLEYGRPETILINSNRESDGIWEDGAWPIDDCEYYEGKPRTT